MKKILLVLLASLLLVGCNKETPTTTAGAPERPPVASATPEVEGEKADMSGYIWLEDSDHVFVALSYEDFIDFMENKGTAIVYFGYAGCPWCERAVPELNAAAKQAGITVYYMNAHSEVAPSEEVSNKVFELLTPLQDEDGGMFVPEVIAIKDGEIVDDHLALVDDFEIDSEDAQMNDEQKKALQDIYLQLFEEIK